ncbi:MAG: hypothetical protein ACYC96_15605 [Fimbriimonadaceae bacterium]
MLLTVLAFLQANPATSTTLELFRGARVYGPGVSATYQDVEDTVLDRSSPESVHGGDYTLIGGEGRTLLIRFGDIADAIGRNARILDATLVLTSTSNDKPALQSVGIVNEAWGEGPFKTLGAVLKPGAEPPKGNPNAFAATWKSRMAGLAGSGWKTAGAIGPDVTPIANAAGNVVGAHFEVGGLGGAVNSMVADPGENNGFAVTFASDAEFYSSESSIGRPELRITYMPRIDTGSGDVAVEDIVPERGGYVAHVCNLGAEPVSGVKAIWSVDAQRAQAIDLPTAIAPGQVVPVRYEGAVKTNSADHRYGAITLRLVAGANDGHLRDKQLTVYAAGLPITVLATRESLATLAGAASARGSGAANWVQAQLDFVNDVVLARSRYSFATEGCLERIRLAAIKDVGSGVGGSAPNEITVEAKFGRGGAPWLDFGFIRRILVAIGAPDLGASDFPLGSSKVSVPGWTVGGGSLCPDLTGGGDTRYDGGIARQSLLPQIPVFDPILSAPGLEPTGLLSAAGVATLDKLQSVQPAGRVAAQSAASRLMPTTVLVAVYDASGAPLKHAELSFFESRGGVIGDQPVFKATTGSTGTVLLPRPRTGKTGLDDEDWAAGGAYLVQANTPGIVGWGWLKGWQLVDAAYRGDTEFASVPLYEFMTPAGVDRSVNRALGRSVKASTGGEPSTLTPLVDGLGQTSVRLPENPGDWIEVDLNRDWTLAELRLTAKGAAPWRRFAIRVYQTGQTAASAIDWASEADWEWSARNRGVADSDGRTSVAYNGPPVQIRYIRIVCLEHGDGKLAQIQAFSTLAGG